MQPERRRFLKLAGLGAGALACGRAAFGPERGVPAVPAALAQTGPDLELALEAGLEPVALRPDRVETMLRYRARVIAGDPAAVWDPGPPFPGPVLRARRGQRLRIHFRNALAEPTTVHWHGLEMPDDMDGHPRHAVEPGAGRVYDFALRNQPATYWFHPHPHGRTAWQVYHGLAGLLLIDPAESQPAEATPRELALVLQDRRFDAAGALVYDPTPMGFLGDEVFVNGRPAPELRVPAEPLRLRLLNGATHRSFKLGWSDGRPVRVLGTDGGALEPALDKPYAMLAPGQRLTLLADFGPLAEDGELRLEHLGFEDGAGGMMALATRLPLAARFPVARFRAAEPTAAATLFLPSLLRGAGSRGGWAAASPGLQPLPPATDRPTVRSKGGRPSLPTQDGPADRSFRLLMQQGRWTLDGRSFEMEAVAADERVALGAEEVWEWVNGSGGMGMGGMMQMPHAMHLHLVQFRVVGRDPDPRFAAAYATVRDGFVDEGWRDTVLVMPGERVRIRARFEGFTGLYLHHCHLLEHEDGGMMRNFRVEA